MARLLACPEALALLLAVGFRPVIMPCPPAAAAAQQQAAQQRQGAGEAQAMFLLLEAGPGAVERVARGAAALAAGK